MSKVSIIVPFYNCPYIEKALESLINQTYKNIEIIVVDDGSTLYSEKIEPFLDKILFIKKENGGTASALNTGIEHATGDYICWLSSDDIFYPEKTEIQLRLMERKMPNLAIRVIIASMKTEKSSPRSSGSIRPHGLNSLKR